MYQLRQPAAPLSPYIENYWFVESTADDPVDLRVDVFVDARADLILNFGAPYTREVLGVAGARASTREISVSNLDAQRLVPIRIRQRGAVQIAGVRFRLGGLGAFAAVPLAPFTGATPHPRDILGADADPLQSAIRDARDADERARHFDAFFAAHLIASAPFRRFEAALGELQRDDSPAAVAQIAAAASVSTRQLERLFARFLGVTPSTLVRVLRFQRALHMLMRDPACTLADVAAAAGYFDQAHFIRDFRAMSGGVPRGYRGYYPEQGPHDFAPNVVVFVQDAAAPRGVTTDA
ncbi:MAG: AraC family transcriptional regulator [Myxococcales bacterium]|nr:AraC family transcriptional regulator [Myxococcales bacterium]